MKKQQMHYSRLFVIRFQRIFLLVLLISLVFATKANAFSVEIPSCKSISPNSSEIPLVAARIRGITPTSDPSAIQIQCYQDGDLSTTSIVVEAPELKAALESLRVGDQVALRYNSENELQSLSVVTQEVQWFTRIAAIVIAALTLLFIFWLFLKKGPYHLIVGMDNRYSNSKTQIVLWFFILMTTYLATSFLRGFYGGINFFGGVSIPQNLLLLSGLSAFTFVTAKGITQSSLPPGEEKEKADKPQFPDDLFYNDKQREHVDLGDFQMIIVTLVAVFVYLAEVLGFLGTIELHKTVTLPDVDSTILTTFGLGQGAYLVKKYIEDVGVGGRNLSPASPNPDVVGTGTSLPSSTARSSSSTDS